MIKWIIGIIIAFLLIDHFWVHVGGKLLERKREDYKEITGKSPVGVEKTGIPLQQAHKKSILDNLWERLNNAIKNVRKEGGN